MGCSQTEARTPARKYNAMQFGTPSSYKSQQMAMNGWCKLCIKFLQPKFSTFANHKSLLNTENKPLQSTKFNQ